MKKLSTIILIGLIVVIGASCAGGGTPGGDLELPFTEEKFEVNLPPPAGASGGATFEQATELPEVGDTMAVYRVKPVDVTTDSVIAIGRKLEFKGDAGPIDGGTRIAMLDETPQEVRQLAGWVDSGAVEYNIVWPDKLYPQTPPDLPSDEEAAQIATEFLANSGLLPADAEVGEVVVGGKSGEIVTHLLVRFTRQIDGIPVAGPGAKFGVRIGDNGEVIRLLKVWREVESYKRISINSPQQAYQGLIAGEGSYVVPLDCQKVVIEGVSLAYWMEACPEKQEYVAPIYEFRGKCLDEEGKYLEDFIGWSRAQK